MTDVQTQPQPQVPSDFQMVAVSTVNDYMKGRKRIYDDACLDLRNDQFRYAQMVDRIEKLYWAVKAFADRTSNSNDLREIDIFVTAGCKSAAVVLKEELETANELLASRLNFSELDFLGV